MSDKLIFPYESDVFLEKNFISVQKIYNNIVDEMSKNIWLNRLLLSLTGDLKYAKDLVLCTSVGKEFQQFLQQQREIYVYGAGIRGTRLVQMFPDMNWRGYIDKNKVGRCNGYDIIKPESVYLSDNDIILISNQDDSDAIKKDLVVMGLDENMIICVNDWEIRAQEDQYFEKRCIKYFDISGGAFIDAGCFDGRDCLRFMESTVSNDNIMYAFEPDPINYQICKENLSHYSDVKIYNMGLSNKKEEVSFLSGKGEKARIAHDGNCYINMDTIDSILENQNIGFIKMDIEGNERQALEGARQHIEKNAPNLAISIYHKVEDIIEIPKILLNMNSKYRFAFGHYSLGIAETVLYAFE